MEIEVPNDGSLPRSLGVTGQKTNNPKQEEAKGPRRAVHA
jgi:hypothetical protein